VIILFWENASITEAANKIARIESLFSMIHVFLISILKQDAPEEGIP
jgi:hypothetical protein